MLCHSNFIYVPESQHIFTLSESYFKYSFFPRAWMENYCFVASLRFRGKYSTRTITNTCSLSVAFTSRGSEPPCKKTHDIIAPLNNLLQLGF